VLTAERDVVCHDVFRQGHAYIACIAKVMQIRAGHFAHQCNLPADFEIGTSCEMPTAVMLKAPRP